MTREEPIVDEDHLEAIESLARELGASGIRLMALGSSAILLKAGRLGMTKDVDLHPFPVGTDVQPYFQALDAAAKTLHGAWRLEPDGASITFTFPVRGHTVPIELIEGREDYIQPEVLEDAVNSATMAGLAYVPSWEHIIAMKAEAHHDRVGPTKAKFLQDLVHIKASIQDLGERVSRRELMRVIRLRPERKHDGMLRTTFQILADTISD